MRKLFYFVSSLLLAAPNLSWAAQATSATSASTSPFRRSTFHQQTHLPFISNKNEEKKGRIRWHVRPATLEDKEEIERMLESSFSELLRSHYDEEFVKRAVLVVRSPPPDLFECPTWYVVQHPATGVIVGCGGWTIYKPGSEAEKTEEGEKAYPNLRYFATHPDWVRCGVGRAVWDRVWRDVCEEFGPSTPMEVYSSLNGESFYASLGFRTVGHVVVNIQQGFPHPCVFLRREP